MLIFVLPTKKGLVVSFWTFFKYLGHFSNIKYRIDLLYLFI